MQLLKRNKAFILFVVIIILIGLLSGIVYYQLLDKTEQSTIINTINNFNNFRYNAILKDITVSSLLLISSFFIIGIPLNLFYLFYEGVSIGFLLNIFYITFKLKGLLYIIIYLFINKLFSLLLMALFVQKNIRISRYIIGLIIYPKKENIKDKIINNFKSNLYIIVFIFIIDMLLYLITPLIFNKIAFLLK